ncbi:YgaP family membrane protein [Methylocystis parvus]|uniref:DUF2892 domain-containing protein n=1 Tax=Methylocystis parvus TaxID=134 RepID=A0A6B8M766_9HYPH|nr:DUF2892 domain-containing protein [Methylocystis parvus]QGM97173.1 DUF2892 domain-containing protein [Methylocystis parvus]WBJ98923.1 DUF2892 domain-containing protein [Methylocystis parvus OBBP]
MSIDRIVMAFAGTMILLSVTLAHLVSPWWMLLAGFVGLNLLQAAFTGFCPLAMMLKRMGVKPGAAF